MASDKLNEEEIFYPHHDLQHELSSPPENPDLFHEEHGGPWKLVNATLKVHLTLDVDAL
jgi:hypothetical protein